MPRSGGTEAGRELHGTNKLACQKLESLPRDVVAVNARPLQKTYSSASITVSAPGLYPGPVLLQPLFWLFLYNLGGGCYGSFEAFYRAAFPDCAKFGLIPLKVQ